MQVLQGSGASTSRWNLNPFLRPHRAYLQHHGRTEPIPLQGSGSQGLSHARHDSIGPSPHLQQTRKDVQRILVLPHASTVMSR